MADPLAVPAVIVAAGRGTRVWPASVILKWLFPTPGPGGILEPALARHVRLLTSDAVESVTLLVSREVTDHVNRILSDLGYAVNVVGRQTRSLRASVCAAVEIAAKVQVLLILPDLIPIGNEALAKDLVAVAAGGSAISVARVPVSVAAGTYGVIRAKRQGSRLIGVETLEKPDPVPERFVNNGTVLVFAGYYLAGRDIQDQLRRKGSDHITDALQAAMCATATGIPLVEVAGVMDLGLPHLYVSAVSQLAKLEWNGGAR